MPGNRPDFGVNLFYREDFVHLYDELYSPGIKPSRSWSLPVPVDPLGVELVGKTLVPDYDLATGGRL
jgi:hypothetical protein